MAKMWRIFRESGPPPEIPEHLYTMEIFHGGYFDKQLDGTKKYKVAREKFISYLFKLSRTSSNKGFIPIKNDVDAIEMVKEAELDDLKPNDPDWENPLNRCTPSEKERMFEAANLLGSQLNTSPSRATVGTSVPEIIDLEDEGGSDGNEGETMVGDGLNVGREEGGVNVEVRPSQSTFAGLFDIVPDVLGSQASIGQKGHSRKSGQTKGHKAALNKKLEDIERREREAVEKAEKEAWEKVEREVAELRESQATVEEQEEAQRLREREAAEQLAREEEEKREQDAVEKRVRDAVVVRKKLEEELRERLEQSKAHSKARRLLYLIKEKD
ncbi:uncharacterized protein LOC133711126 [Rosa rugosa]|uniref:uncharacterized protein LOC133711126 n=1 Tax=Rosa rugosa TaxID=74645 RepID=UPI002B417C26|nr:uncharacterized protein LOC133711126 [Rosa rugosa]